MMCSVRQVLVQGCELGSMDLEKFLQQIYQQLRAVESNIAEVLQQQQNQARAAHFCVTIVHILIP